jgi:signal transduction histidine kinase
MLIAPSVQQSTNIPKKPHRTLAIVHWSLMTFFWILLIPSIYYIIGIKTGKLFKYDHTILVSTVFALALLMIVYSIGVTLFFFANLSLNKFKDKKYVFFVRLNSLVLAAFIVAWIFTFISF